MITIKEEIKEKFDSYAHLIFETNKRFNLTGFKTVEGIYKKLILGSIEPLYRMNVPRGTKFIDLGSGAGIPGIPLGILFKETFGVLIESNRRKADFIMKVIDKLDLNNLTVECGRAEDVAHDALHREQYDWCFTRSFNNLYISMELGSPFIKSEMLLYIFAELSSFPEYMIAHAQRLGLVFIDRSRYRECNCSGSGILLKKIASTPGRYPRRFSVIKRESKRLIGDNNNQ